LLRAPEHDARFAAWDWSPDRTKLIGTLSGPPVNITYYSLETDSYEKVIQSDGNPMWLPDSTRFVFFEDNKAYLGDIRTKKAKEIFSSSDGELRSIDVSADGTLVYFTVYSSESDIWLLDLQ